MQRPEPSLYAHPYAPASRSIVNPGDETRAPGRAPRSLPAPRTRRLLRPPAGEPTRRSHRPHQDQPTRDAARRVDGCRSRRVELVLLQAPGRARRVTTALAARGLARL